MKIILLKDISKVGRKDEIKEVSDGYARNFLLPKKLAKAATPQAMEELEKQQAQIQDQEKIRQDLLHKNLEILKNIPIKIARSANEEGHLFAKLHQSDLSAEIKKQFNIEIPEDFIVIDQPIKSVGEYTIKIRAGQLQSNLKIEITGE